MTKILDHDHDHALPTRAVHAGHVPDPLSGAVMPPIYQTSTYQQEGLGKNKGYEYGRTQNPTREVLERNVASAKQPKLRRGGIVAERETISSVVAKVARWQPGEVTEMK